MVSQNEYSFTYWCGWISTHIFTNKYIRYSAINQAVLVYSKAETDINSNHVLYN